MYRYQYQLPRAVLLLLALNWVNVGRAELVFTPSWQAPAYAQVRGEVLSWLKPSERDPAIARQLPPSLRGNRVH